MSTDPTPQSAHLPVVGDESETVYSLDVISELAGTDSQTVLRYHEIGLIPPVPRHGAGGSVFDSESLRQLRRIEHLRSQCGVNEAGLKLILGLLDEVERLRLERRQLRR